MWVPGESRAICTANVGSTFRPQVAGPPSQHEAFIPRPGDQHLSETDAEIPVHLWSPRLFSFLRGMWSPCRIPCSEAVGLPLQTQPSQHSSILALFPQPCPTAHSVVPQALPPAHPPPPFSTWQSLHRTLDGVPGRLPGFCSMSILYLAPFYKTLRPSQVSSLPRRMLEWAAFGARPFGSSQHMWHLTVSFTGPKAPVPTSKMKTQRGRHGLRGVQCMAQQSP